MRSHSRTYKAWSHMHTRCSDPKYIQWADYGGRGITVCPRWKSFDAFLADMGDCPSGLSLDRIDNDDGYRPGNCRWATAAMQARNRRSTLLRSHQPKQIKWLRSMGLPGRVVASLFGVHEATVSAIVHNRIWKGAA